MPGEGSGSYSGSTHKFWREYSFKNEKDNPHEQGDNPISKEKAKEILSHGTVRGKALTSKQKGFFGARAGGQPYRKG